MSYSNPNYDNRVNNTVSPAADLAHHMDRAFRTEEGQPDRTNYFLSSHAIRSKTLGTVGELYGDIEAMMRRAAVELPEPLAEKIQHYLSARLTTIERIMSIMNSQTLDPSGSPVSSLRDILGKHTTEHIYSSNEEAAQSFLDKLSSRNREER